MDNGVYVSFDSSLTEHSFCISDRLSYLFADAPNHFTTKKAPAVGAAPM